MDSPLTRPRKRATSPLAGRGRRRREKARAEGLRSLHELGVELDRGGREGLRDGAAGFGFVGLILEGGFVDVGDLGLGVQDDLGDLEAFADFVERDVGGGGDAGGVEAGFAQARGEGHREAAGVGGGDELFGVGAGAVLEAAGEGVLAVVRAGSEFDGAFAFLEVSVPDGVGFASGHDDLLRVVDEWLRAGRQDEPHGGNSVAKGAITQGDRRVCAWKMWSWWSRG